MALRVITRKGPAKGLETLRQAKARVEARRALGDFLGVTEGHDRLRLLSALNDVSSDALAEIEGPLATACRLYAKGGRLAPCVDRDEAKRAADAAFSLQQERVAS